MPRSPTVLASQDDPVQFQKYLIVEKLFSEVGLRGRSKSGNFIWTLYLSGGKVKSMPYILQEILGFLICSALIVYSGSRLSRYADMMADAFGWGKMFMGILLLAAVTSLPELVSGIGATVVIDAPDLAVGDIVGSCVFNVLIISIMDVFYDAKKPVISAAQIGHVIAASFGILLLSVVGLSMVKPSILGSIGWIGGFSFAFLFLYVVSMRVIFLYEQRHSASRSDANMHSQTSQIVVFFSLHALVVTLAALALPYFGDHLAKATGLGQSFFGTLFVAASTSLPEIVVSVAAIRLGSIDLAIGNIFGSNIFNIAILAIDDILYKKGPIFQYTSPNHIIPLFGAIIATSIGIIGLIYKSEKKWKLALDSFLILVTYVTVIVILYLNR